MQLKDRQANRIHLKRFSLSFFLAGSCSIVLLGILVFLPALSGEFISDDHSLVEKNPHIRSFRSVPSFFVRDFTASSSSESPTGFYRPLILLSYGIDYFFFHLTSTGYHLTNLFLHLLNAIMLFALFWVLTGRRGCSLFAALLFAFHPVHAESVSWIAGRTDVMATFWGLLSLLVFLKEGKNTKGRPFVFLLPLLFSFLSKENALIMPLLFCILLLFPLKRKRMLIHGIFSSFFLFIIFCGFRWGMLGIRFPENHELPSEGLLLIANCAKLFAHALWKLLFPVSLSFGYEPALLSSFGFEACAYMAGFLLTFFLILLLIRKAKAAAFGLLWLFIAFLPFSGISPITETGAERFLYLPSAGWVLLLGLLLKGRSKAHTPPAFSLLKGFLILLFLVALFHRNLDWREEFTLYTDAARKSPHNAYALYNAGCAHLGMGRKVKREAPGLEGNQEAAEHLGKAEKLFQQSIEREPNQQEARTALGNTYMEILAMDPSNAEVRRKLKELYRTP